MRIQNISLLGLLAIVACAAIGVSHTITSLRLWRANAELALLRQRLELLSVNDTDQIAARRLPSSDPNVQRWAVRIPDASSNLLYVNWGAIPLSEIRDIHSKSTRAFQLAPDPSTHESVIVVRAERNANDPERGLLKIETGGNVSVIVIPPETTSLLMGDLARMSEAIGDTPVARLATSSITLFATESNGTPKSAFCLWLDTPRKPDGG